MVGLLLVTHADFGAEILKAAEMIMGPVDQSEAIKVDVTTEMDTMVEKIREAVNRVEAGDGVLIMTDMFGGSPSNLSLSLLGTGKIEVVTGVNLPMVLKCIGVRESSLSKVSAEARSAGKQGIIVAGEVLRRKVSEG